MTDALADHLARAFDARSDLLARLHSEQTDAYRLFHGSVEGCPGLTIDRYGEVLLVQAFHRSPADTELAAIDAFYARRLPGLHTVFNDRSRPNSRIGNPLPPDQMAIALEPRVIHEMGVRYRIQGRHAGQDPWLFLDLRAARRRLMQEAAGKSVLNLFAYTCGVGIAAAKAGASFVMNVDFAESSLAIGKENAQLNALPHRPRFIQSDAFAALRQLSGIGQPKQVRGKRLPAFPKLEPRQFDLVVLDPPRYAKSPFGVVDLVHDYPAVFKPAWLCVAEGGALIACNNVAAVDRDAWLEQLQRSAAKTGHPVRDIELITPEDDFPSHDGQHPLKIARLQR